MAAGLGGLGLNSRLFEKMLKAGGLRIQFAKQLKGEQIAGIIRQALARTESDTP